MSNDYVKTVFANDSHPPFNAQEANKIGQGIEDAQQKTKVKDSATGKQYRWGMENGSIFLEEV